jgi:uncharacterized protein (DUF2235 family)
MSKRILIFSDGTGQAGGLRFDEDRSNIYKLYRATRVGPESCIDPKVQVAFYDPGLGSQADSPHIWGRGWLRTIYNAVSQATGFGITANVIDCYAAIIRLYEQNDQIYLFGFSRGAYTVRCIAGVLAQCGVPRHLPNKTPLKLDASGARAVASYAVKHIYQFTESRQPREANAYQRFLLDTRALLAKQFREQHGAVSPTNPNDANVYPYFIGVFDTVAALVNRKSFALFAGAFVIGAVVVSGLLSLLPMFFDSPIVSELSFATSLSFILGGAIAITLVVFLFTHIKFDLRVPGYGWWEKLKTIHLTSMWQTFYDRSLNPNVRYAKHAISIDENRKDFRRVEWGRFDPSRPARDELGNPWFEQVWFPGCHSDVGGSYTENESRLSDAALKWMLACASVVPNGITYDASVLQLYPSSSGMQHDERKAGLGWITRRFNINLAKKERELPIARDKNKSEATMHKSVYERFDGAAVLQHDLRGDYRPETLKTHIDFYEGYSKDGMAVPRPNKTRHAIAVDTERKFEQQVKDGTLNKTAQNEVS